VNFADGFEQFGRRQPFQQVAARARRQGAENFLRVLEDGQHHDLGRRQPGLQEAHTLNPIHAAHVDVHEHHIWFFLRHILQRLFRAGVDADAAETFR
jgi:hypothetical protein